MKKTFKDRLKVYIDEVNNYANGYINSIDMHELLRESIKYTFFSGGKRFRPALILDLGYFLNIPRDKLLPIAVAVEFIHNYSLIHDDLPAMDDDDYRRGKLTNHKVFGEDVAILAGDALALLGPQIILDSYFLTDSEKVKITSMLCAAGGAYGIISGQVEDLKHKKEDEETLNYIHEHKTGILIQFCTTAPSILANKFNEELNRFGQLLGLAFQIKDDLLDVEGDEEKVGKKTGKDIEKGKLTYPKIYGIDRSKEFLEEFRKEVEQLQNKTKLPNLLEIYDFVVKRDH